MVEKQLSKPCIMVNLRAVHLQTSLEYGMPYALDRGISSHAQSVSSY